MTENDYAQLQAMGQAQRDDLREWADALVNGTPIPAAPEPDALAAALSKVERLNKHIELIEGSRKSLQALLRELAVIGEKMDDHSRLSRYSILKPFKGGDE